MVTTLFLVRHGETEGSEVKRYKGSIDVPISQNGIEQVKRTSIFINSAVRKLSCSIDAIYCSPLSRASKSAEIIAAPHGLMPIEINELRERSFGIWEGMTFSEIRDKYPAEFDAWAGNPLMYSPIGGESTVEVKDRVIPALEKILSEAGALGNAELELARKPTVGAQARGNAEGPEKEKEQNPKRNYRNSELTGVRTNIVIVAHGGVNRVMLCHLLGIPLENIFRIEQDNASVNIIEFWDNYPVVKLLNGVIGG